MRRFPSVMNKRILILVALVTVLFAGKTIFDITSDRKLVVLSAERLSRGFSSALSEHAVRTFGNAENSLDSFILDVQSSGSHGPVNELRLHRFLASYIQKKSYAPDMFAVAADGRLMAASLEYPCRATDLSDREYYRHHVRSEDQAVFISSSPNNRIAGSRLIVLSKRLSNPDGSLRMVVCITVDPLYFNSFYRTIELGRNDRIFLLRRDGAILTMEPYEDKFIEWEKSRGIYKNIVSGETHSGTFRLARSAVDGTARILSYRHSEWYPVVSLVSLNENDALARWRARSVRSAGGALLLLVLVGTLGTLVYHQIRELKQSEDKYSLIAATANEGIWMLDAHDRILFVNPRVSDMFGYLGEEMVGRCIGDFMAPNQLDDHAGRMALRKQGVAERYERCFLHKSGSEVWTIVSAAALIGDDKQYQGVVAMCVDISERKRSQERQARLEEELRQAHKMEAVGIMAGGMAHDFNNLLQSIMGYVFLAKMGVEENGEIHDYLHEAEKISGQACELGQRLLLLSRGGVTMLRNTSLPPLILTQVNARLEGTAITGEFDLPADMPWVTVDESLMKQVFTQLTANAIETMPHGGMLKITAVTVTITPKQELPLPSGQYVHIVFSDTGAGIPAAHLPKIFDPYFTTKEKRSEKGLGLGLALCHTIIRKHKGLINVSSSVGKGATFNIYLPIAAPEHALAGS